MVEPLPNPFIAALASEARNAGLRYTSDHLPGIRRRNRGNSFAYVRPDGKAARDPATLGRIKRLAIPPAWKDVWINPQENGHLQATGRDARGRKQYRYHPDWRQQRDGNKFERMAAFARALPGIRRRVKRDLARPGMPREKVLGTIVRLLESTLIRVGNDEYARENGSYGLTTMRNRHAQVAGAKIVFRFRGKSGKHHELCVSDPQLARIVRRCQELPGQELFGFEDEDGKAHHLSSQDVNAYLREISGEDFTAKDFRTWAGTVLAAVALRALAPAPHVTQAKKNIVAAIVSVAQLLGNTPAVCRKSYVHPGILDSYLEGETIAGMAVCASVAKGGEPRGLRMEEKAVLAMLKRQRRAGLQKAKAAGRPAGGGRKKTGE